MSKYFTEEDSAEAVIARLKNCADPRFKQIMESVIRHLHGFVKEVEPTMEEWIQAIQFLTTTGQMCDDKRQEWILASDTLGVSMLVETINHRARDGRTEATVLGPFHVDGVPSLEMGANICLDGKGEPCVVSGKVLALDGNPIDGAVLDIWQTNGDGFYDVQQPGVQPDINLRGKFENRRGWALLVPHSEACVLPGTDRWPGRKDAECHGPPCLSSRPHPLHRYETRLRTGSDAHLRRRRSLSRLRCGVRREGVPDRAVHRAAGLWPRQGGFRGHAVLDR